MSGIMAIAADAAPPLAVHSPTAAASLPTPDENAHNGTSSLASPGSYRSASAPPAVRREHEHHPAANHEDNDNYRALTDEEEYRRECVFEEERTLKREKRLLGVQGCYIALGAVLGALVRMLLAQMFGEHCANPGSVGWLAASSPLCVTSVVSQGGGGGVTFSQTGGVLFADWPANMLGSFLMGLFQDGTVLGLALPMPLAWLAPTHSLQRMPALHTAFKTGFCGSLTTFSSWNSAMIVLIFGTESNLRTQIWLALFGYVIGMETALGGFSSGMSFARYLHQYVNPDLAQEAIVVRERREEGVYIHWDLPDFERRFLSRLNMGDAVIDIGLERFPQDHLDLLERWRVSTEHVRRVRHPLLQVMLNVEGAILCENHAPSKDVEMAARAEGMDIDSLKRWTALVAHTKSLSRLSSTSSFAPVSPEDASHPAKISRFMTLPVAGGLIWLAVFLCLMGLLLCKNADSAAMITYRTMSYSAMIAPVGALIRWQLSNAYNGSLSKHPWFPLGTFAANFSGSLISITALALEFHFLSSYNPRPQFWTIGTLRALRIGLAGCLTTVSTFVQELHSMMQAHSDQTAYPYMWISLGSSCLVGSLIYGSIIYAMAD